MSTQVLMGIIVSIALALSSFALKEIYDMNASITLLQKEVQHEAEVKRTLSKFWKLHSWAREEVNELRVREGLPLARWPSLSSGDGKAHE